jgi:hypothetical protein
MDKQKQYKFLSRLRENIKYLESRGGEVIVYDGKIIGPRQEQTQNMVTGTTVSDTNEEAKTQSLFEDSVLGRLQDDEDLDEDQINNIIFLYAEKMIDGIMEDI